MKYKIFFYIYAVLLIFLILFKFCFTLNQIEENILIFRESGYNRLNLELFRTIKMQINHIREEWAIKNLLGNTIPFIVYGVLYELAFKQKIIKAMLINLNLVVLIEIIQLVFIIGTFDIDDILLNTLCIFLGVMFIKEVIKKEII